MPTTTPIQAVLDLVSQTSGITMAELLGMGRTGPVAEARFLAYHLCREVLSLTLVQTAKALHRRDHGSVMHGLRAVQHRANASDDYRRQLQALERAARRAVGKERPMSLARQALAALTEILPHLNREGRRLLIAKLNA